MSPTPHVGCTVAGTDSGGAAGIAADLATFNDHGLHAACVVTAVTAQDTTGVHAVQPIGAQTVRAQLAAVLDDLPVAVVKTGMLGAATIVDVVREALADRVARGELALVVDPVLVATSGAVLGDDEVIAAYRDLLPVASLSTPNADEARALLGLRADDLTPPRDLAVLLAEKGAAVVVTGGPAPGERHATCVDWLALPGHPPQPLEHACVDTENDHGSGCTFAAALAARLATARPGDDLAAAVRAAATYTRDRLRAGATWNLGRGRGPIAHTRLETGSH